MCLQYYIQEWRVVVGDDLGPASMCGRACKQKGQKGNTQERQENTQEHSRSAEFDDPKRRTHVRVPKWYKHDWY